ncbi:MarR family winged helix-turn-helix transcriptional regulator [Seohaeicola nanhaiensis]|uniref:MarR family winged helix-turn-helix transcriptional regulator n=1 Tax=Seohaeicola nanhaiensis TaxID=1387282 RepID=A0ABV9KFM6_9RHOB
MTEPRPKKNFRGKTYFDVFEENLRASRVPSGAADALLSLDMTLFQLMRHTVKADLVVAFLKQGNTGLEPAVFQGLAAVLRIGNGVGRPAPGEPTVGAVAEELNIDPSRASRITAALIEQGYIRRVAAQKDGRKSLLEVTETGWELLFDFFQFKWLRMVRIFEDWSEEEIVTFSRLLGRYGSQIANLGSEGT